MSIFVSGRCGGVDPFFDVWGILLGLRWCVFGPRISQNGIVLVLIYKSLVQIYLLFDCGHYLGASSLVKCSKVNFTASLARFDVEIPPVDAVGSFVERIRR